MMCPAKIDLEQAARERIIYRKKLEFSQCYRAYRTKLDQFDNSNPLAKYMNGVLRDEADHINDLAAWLQKNDPQFPEYWIPL